MASIKNKFLFIGIIFFCVLALLFAYFTEYVLKHLHKDSLVFIHDFWNRPQYHAVFEWYDEVNSIKTPGTQTIVVLKPKKEYINNVIT